MANGTITSVQIAENPLLLITGKTEMSQHSELIARLEDCNMNTAKYELVMLCRDSLKALQALERVPMTKLMIWQLANDCTIAHELHADKFARAIEAHHGIKPPESKG